MKNYAKILVAAAAISSIIGVTAVAETRTWSSSGVNISQWTEVNSNPAYKGAADGYKTTLSCNQIYDTSIILNFRSTNGTYTSSTATILYPAKSATATYSSYASGYYHPSVKLAPTSRYSSASLSGNFTP